MSGVPRHLARMAVSLAFVAPLATGAGAEPGVRESVEHYEIRGSTAKQLKEEMKRLGPRNGGQGYIAYTKWRVTWTYAFSQRDEECVLSSFDVAVDVTITLPEWDHEEADADPELVARWERFSSALEAHEEGHRRFGVESAAAVERRLSALGAEPTCDDLEHTIGKTARGIVESYRQNELRFDEDTKHGRASGASL